MIITLRNTTWRTSSERITIEFDRPEGLSQPDTRKMLAGLEGHTIELPHATPGQVAQRAHSPHQVWAELTTGERDDWERAAAAVLGEPRE